MPVKTFRAPTMKDAISKVKSELGPNAVVLTTRTVKSLGSIMGRPEVEVTASFEGSPAPAQANATVRTAAAPKIPAAYSADPADGQNVDVRGVVGELAARVDRLERGMDERIRLRLDRMATQLEELMRAIAGVQDDEALGGPSAEDASLAEPIRQPLLRLTHAGVESGLAREMAMTAGAALDRLPAVEDDSIGLDLMAREIMTRVDIRDPFAEIGRRQIVCALVGPTGVGKTTTIAKLAAMQVFDRGRKAAFLTIDTFRIGAVDQLRTYARIMGAPLDVAVDERDLAEKIARHADKDVIFVDTAGASQKDAPMMRRLAGYFDGIANVDCHLIVSATTQGSDLLDIADCYGGLQISTLIASKLDECTALGGVFNLVARRKMPLSFFTIGQNVPEDIETATRERLVDKLLGITAH